MRHVPTDRRNRLVLAALALLLALGFLGARGIWDPDEGRYSNVALNMVQSGDWITPHRSEEVAHWTKPPLTYWLLAASAAVFGSSPWAMRLPGALAYLACIWLAWRIAARLRPGAEHGAGLAFATMLLPFGSANFVSTDFPLAALQGVAMLGYVEARFGTPERSGRWLALMWAGFGLAFLTKGPPGLVALIAVFALQRLAPGAPRLRVVRWRHVVLFAAVALPWYAVACLQNPGLLGYFLGSEVVARVTTDTFKRHGEWYGWIVIYGPTLLLGALPWLLTVVRAVRNLSARARDWRSREARESDAQLLLLVLWIALPLTVFCVARSRLPLYILPLFLPIAILVSMQWDAEGRGQPRSLAWAAWVVAMLALRVGSAHWPTHKDAAPWAAAIESRARAPVTQILFVDDMTRYGLNVYLGADIKKVSTASVEDAHFNPEYDAPLPRALRQQVAGALWITKQSQWPEVARLTRSEGYIPRPLGLPFEGRVFFDVEGPRATTRPSHPPASSSDRNDAAHE